MFLFIQWGCSYIIFIYIFIKYITFHFLKAKLDINDQISSDKKQLIFKGNRLGLRSKLHCSYKKWHSNKDFPVYQKARGSKMWPCGFFLPLWKHCSHRQSWAKGKQGRACQQKQWEMLWDALCLFPSVDEMVNRTAAGVSLGPYSGSLWLGPELKLSGT